MMSYVTKQMLRMFSEDAGSPELRTPELGRYQGGEHKRAAKKSARSMRAPAIYAWLSYEQIKQM